MKERVFTDLEQRKLVWIALSDLFLDTDTTTFHENIVKALLASPYSVEELKQIMLNEVYPVLRWNLICVAGEWSGFDEDLLVEKIQKRPNTFSYIWTNTVGKLSVASDIEWRKILKEIKYRRAN